MYKSGLIFGAIMLILGFGLALLSPICTVCMAPLIGALAGYLAGVFDKPVDNVEALKAGLIAGAIGGVGALLGQLIGASVNTAIMGAEGAADLAYELGLPVGSGFEDVYLTSMIGSTCCFSLVDILSMALLGMLGGLLWWQFSGKKMAQLVIQKSTFEANQSDYMQSPTIDNQQGSGYQ